jgi:hypothetical protein
MQAISDENDSQYQNCQILRESLNEDFYKFIL